MAAFLKLAMAAQVAFAASTASVQNMTFPGSAATYTVPTAFPTSVYPSYYGAYWLASMCRVPIKASWAALTCGISQAGRYQRAAAGYL